MDANERDKKIKIVLLEVQQALLTPSEGLKAIRDVSEEYAKQKCKEQKEICVEEIMDNSDFSEEQLSLIENCKLATDK